MFNELIYDGSTGAGSRDEICTSFAMSRVAKLAQLPVIATSIALKSERLCQPPLWEMC